MTLRRLLDRLSPGTSARLVASVAVERGDKLLVVREGRRHKRDRWNLPGGRVDRGEGIVAAAVRETREETGVIVEATGLAGIYHYYTRSRQEVVLFLLVARPVGGKERADGEEILEVAWRTLDELLDLSDDDLARPHLLRIILRDLQRGHVHSLTSIREIGMKKE